MMSKKKKIRVELRKNRSKPPRDRQFTREFRTEQFEEDRTVQQERVRAKGDISRYRTIIEEVETKESMPSNHQNGTTNIGFIMPAVDANECLRGRVIRVQGLHSTVELESGKLFQCTIRRVLKSLMTESRSILTTGDIVWIRPGDDPNCLEGVIERVEPRKSVLTRASRRSEHILVANVDQVVIVMSLVEPDLKVHLIDRYLASAQLGKLKAIICLNKADRIRIPSIQPLLGAYSQLGIKTILTSIITGEGIEELRGLLVNKASVFSGQSGVGKSSLLNAIQPGFKLRVGQVSELNQKGRHTTTTSEFIQLSFGGWVVDTPGIRQLQLWQVKPNEVEGFFTEFYPFIPHCSYPDCTHTHEDKCAVKIAVDRHQIAVRRYQSYLGLLKDCLENQER